MIWFSEDGAPGNSYWFLQGLDQVVHGQHYLLAEGTKGCERGRVNKISDTTSLPSAPLMEDIDPVFFCLLLEQDWGKAHAHRQIALLSELLSPISGAFCTIGPCAGSAKTGEHQNHHMNSLLHFHWSTALAGGGLSWPRRSRQGASTAPNTSGVLLLI